MLRLIVVSLLSVMIAGSSAEAALQSVLVANLTLQSLQNSPLEGAIFVDMTTSTVGAAAYRNGPDFSYDRTTGDLAVSAPPMLTPADEFGLRNTYSPQSVTIVASSFWGTNRGLPDTKIYARNTPEPLSFYLDPPPLADSDPSFILSDADTYHYLSYNSSDLVLSGVTHSDPWSGAELFFPSLLSPGLTSDNFLATSSASTGMVLPSWSTSEYDNEKIQIIVQYGLSPINYIPILSNRYNILASPTGAVAAPIPEPSSLLLTGIASIACLLWQLKSQKVRSSQALSRL